MFSISVRNVEIYGRQHYLIDKVPHYQQRSKHVFDLETTNLISKLCIENFLNIDYKI